MVLEVLGRGWGPAVLAVALLAGCTETPDERPGSVHWVRLDNEARAGTIMVLADGVLLTSREAPLGVSEVDVVLGCPATEAHLEFILDDLQARLGGGLCQAGDLLRVSFANGTGTAFVGQAP